jgi:hypothetical protein
MMHGADGKTQIGINRVCHFEGSEKPAFVVALADNRFLVAALLGMTSRLGVRRRNSNGLRGV